MFPSGTGRSAAVASEGMGIPFPSVTSIRESSLRLPGSEASKSKVRTASSRKTFVGSVGDVMRYDVSRCADTERTLRFVGACAILKSNLMSPPTVRCWDATSIAKRCKDQVSGPGTQGSIGTALTPNVSLCSFTHML